LENMQTIVFRDIFSGITEFSHSPAAVLTSTGRPPISLFIDGGAAAT
jgi:hypothetical protein